MPEETTVHEVLSVLAGKVQELTTWEVGFLAKVRQQSFPLTNPQRATLVQIAEAHCDPLLAAELRGQLRLIV